MKKLNKLIAIFVLISLIFSLLVGCTQDEISVLNALVKSGSIKSMESKTNMTFRFEANGFSEEVNEKIQFVAPLLNDLKINVNQKVNQNEDKSVIKSQIDTFFEVGGVSTGLGVWVDSNTAGDKPYIKEIIKMPAIATIALPSQLKGKQYMVMDMADIPGIGKEFVPDFKQIVDFSNNFTGKFLEFMKEFGSQLDPGFKFITYKGGRTSANGEFLTYYELKLDDNTFKALAKASIDNLLKNKKTIELIKELLTSAGKLSSTTNPLSGSYDMQVEEIMGSLHLDSPETIEMVNKVFEVLKDVKLVGDKGITITYGINNDGYIASESGSMDFSLNMKEIGAAVQKFIGMAMIPGMDQTLGVINFGFDYSTDISKINKDVPISFPELTSKNSFTYAELDEALNPTITHCYGFASFDLIDTPVDIMIDGKVHGSKAVVNDGIILIPLRSVSQTLGAKVAANTKNQTITVQKGDTKIVFKTNSDEATVNGQKIKLYSPMVAIDKKNYVPVNIITDNLSARTQWNRKTNTLIITSGYKKSNEADLLLP